MQLWLLLGWVLLVDERSLTTDAPLGLMHAAIFNDSVNGKSSIQLDCWRKFLQNYKKESTTHGCITSLTLMAY